MEKFKRKNGYSYRVKVYVDGKSISKTFKRKTDANRWKRKILVDRDQGSLTGNVPYKGIPFSDFSKMWMDKKVVLRHAPSTVYTYKRNIECHLLPVIGDTRIDRISIVLATKLVEKLQSEGKNQKGVHCILGLLKGMLNDAVKWQLITANPIQFFPPLKELLRNDCFWTVTEVNQFLRANLNHWLYPTWILLLNTGIRRGEAAGLKWDRVHFPTRQIEITRILDRYGLRETTKSGQKRTVPRNDTVRDTLWSLWSQRNTDSPFVCCRPDGRHLDTQHLYREFKHARERAGLETAIRLHDLRHTFASQFMMAGGNIFDLQRILGHSSVEMTQRYAHLSPSHLVKAVNVINFSTNHQ